MRQKPNEILTKNDLIDTLVRFYEREKIYYGWFCLNDLIYYHDRDWSFKKLVKGKLFSISEEEFNTAKKRKTMTIETLLPIKINEPVFCSIGPNVGDKWKLYQVYYKDNELVTAIIAQEIPDEKTAKIMSVILSNEFMGQSINLGTGEITPYREGIK